MRKPYQPIEHRLSTDYYFVIDKIFDIILYFLIFYKYTFIDFYVNLYYNISSF